MPSQDSNTRPVNRKSDALSIAPRRQTHLKVGLSHVIVREVPVGHWVLTLLCQCSQVPLSPTTYSNIVSSPLAAGSGNLLSCCCRNSCSCNTCTSHIQPNSRVSKEQKFCLRWRHASSLAEIFTQLDHVVTPGSQSRRKFPIRKKPYIIAGQLQRIGDITPRRHRPAATDL